MGGGVIAEEQVEQFQFDTVLVPRDWAIQGALRRNSKWELVADGEKAVLFHRKAAAASGTILRK